MQVDDVLEFLEDQKHLLAEASLRGVFRRFFGGPVKGRYALLRWEPLARCQEIFKARY